MEMGGQDFAHMRIRAECKAYVHISNEGDLNADFHVRESEPRDCLTSTRDKTEKDRDKRERERERVRQWH